MAIPALRDISLDVDAGEIVGLVGRPGAGKSTLLLCLAGLLRPDEGSITWFGEQVTGHHVPAGLAYVPQRAGYYSFLTVREALEYYATLHDLSSANRTAQVESALRAAGIRAVSDLRNEKITYKIREHSIQKLPYQVIVGDKEVAARTVSARTRAAETLAPLSLEAFISRLQSEIEARD